MLIKPGIQYAQEVWFFKNTDFSEVTKFLEIGSERRKKIGPDKSSDSSQGINTNLKFKKNKREVR